MVFFNFTSNVSGTQNVISGESTGAQYQNSPIDELRNLLTKGGNITSGYVALTYVTSGTLATLSGQVVNSGYVSTNYMISGASVTSGYIAGVYVTSGTLATLSGQVVNSGYLNTNYMISGFVGVNYMTSGLVAATFATSGTVSTLSGQMVNSGYVATNYMLSGISISSGYAAATYALSTTQDYDIAEYVAMVSGSVYNVVNTASKVVTQSGSDAYQTIQPALNALTLGQTLLFKKGLYQCASSLMPLGNTSVIGGAGGWPQGVQIRASGNIPAMILSGAGANQFYLSNIRFTHNEATFSGGVLKFLGSVQGVSVENCVFDDFGRQQGSCIEFNNGGQFIGPTFNLIVNTEFFGYQDQLLFYCSGGAAISGCSTNGQQFTTILSQQPARSFAMFKTSTAADVDQTMFTSINFQGVGGGTTPPTMFDYYSQMSGNSYQNKHVECFATDLAAGGVYAATNANTYIDMVACQGDAFISGVGATNGQLGHYSVFSNNGAQTTITSSGVGTKAWFVPHNLQIGSIPQVVIATPANALTASSGGAPFVTTVNASGFTINAPNAVNSGSAMSWYWRANV